MAVSPRVTNSHGHKPPSRQPRDCSGYAYTLTVHRKSKSKSKSKAATGRSLCCNMMACFARQRTHGRACFGGLGALAAGKLAA